MSTALPVIGQVDPRVTRAVLFGAGIAFAMFWSMQTLIATGVLPPGEIFNTVPVEWGGTIKDTEPEGRIRKPIKPEPPKPPEMKKLVVEQPTPDARPELIPIPTLDPSPTGIGPIMDTTGRGVKSSALEPVMRVAPQYPRAASRDGISGYVVFELVINPDGTVRSARAIEAQPRGVFEASAMQAIMRWKFRPRVEDGVAVEARGTQQIDFKLGNE